MTQGGADHWLGIDLGTQSVRVMAVRGDGRVSASAARPLTSRRHDGRHEQDPAEWWSALCACAREVTAAIPAAGISGVAVDATSGTILLADRHGAATSPGLMYDDNRGAPYLSEVNEAGAELWSELGYQRMQAVWALPKILWLLGEARGEDSDVRILHQTDYINERLVGHPVRTDLSSALKTGADLIRGRWPGAVFDRLGLSAAILPELGMSGSPVGVVGPHAAVATGIPQAVPVVAGLTDGCAAQLAAGCTRPGIWNSVLGTTLVLKGVSNELIIDPTGAVYSHRAPDGGWLPGGASSTGAARISTDFAGLSLAALNKSVGQRAPTPVLCYPLTGEGERFPFVAQDARAFTIGTPGDTVERYAAVLQGVAFVERLAFEHLQILGARVDAPVLLTGGGSRSHEWCQIRSDVLGLPVAVPEHADPAFGMAVLAAASVTGRTTASVAADMVRIRHTFEPRKHHADRLTELYEAFCGELRARGWLTSTSRPEPSSAGAPGMQR